MRKIFGVVVFFICFVSLAANPASHSFKTGKLLDVTTEEILMQGTSMRHAIFTVQIGDIVYTLQGKHLVYLKGRDYAEGLIVGDPVQVSIEGNEVFLLRPDGKELKTSILKRERAAAK
jgi:hypothetical protein